MLILYLDATQEINKNMSTESVKCYTDSATLGFAYNKRREQLGGTKGKFFQEISRTYPQDELLYSYCSRIQQVIALPDLPTSAITEISHWYDVEHNKRDISPGTNSKSRFQSFFHLQALL
jgi:hypothetical protein